MLLAQSATASRSLAQASAAGAEEDDGSNPDGVNDQNQQQLDFANTQAASRTDSGATDSSESPDASSSDGSVSVAAAISVNLGDARSAAQIADGTLVTAAGAASVMSRANSDAAALADASATSSDGGVSVGAAVSLNRSETLNLASVGDETLVDTGATLTADGVTVNALMAERSSDISSDTVVDLAADTLLLEGVEGLETADEVTYQQDDEGSAIGGLTDDTTYYLIDAGDGKYKLALNETDANNGVAIDLTSLGEGTQHTLERAGEEDIKFNPQYELTFDLPQGYITGDEVVYHNGGGTDITGLTDGETYYLIVGEDIKLAESREAALAGDAVEISGSGSGDNHSLTESFHRTAAASVSGASGGDVGVAGSLAINLADVETTAQIAADSQISLLNNSSLSLNSESSTQSWAMALPLENAGGESVGIGASVALNVSDNDTLSELAENASVTGADNISLVAEATHDQWVLAQAGATGGVAITPVVALNIAFNDTAANLQAGSLLDISGDLTLSAEQHSRTTADAEGDVEGSDAAIGASLALVSANDTTAVLIARDLTAAGALMLMAKGYSASRTSAKAGAQGLNRMTVLRTAAMTAGLMIRSLPSAPLPMATVKTVRGTMPARMPPPLKAPSVWLPRSPLISAIRIPPPMLAAPI